jgi:signal transduction histidine kinase
MFKTFLEVQDVLRKYKNIRVAMEFATPHIADFVGAHRIITSKKEVDEKTQKIYAGLFHEWYADGAGSRYMGTDVPRRLYIDDIYKIYASTIAVKKPMVLHASEFSLIQDETLKNFYIESGIKSILSIGIYVNNELWGTMTIHDVNEERDFKTDGTIDRLQMVTNELGFYLSTLDHNVVESHKRVDDHSVRMTALGKMAAGIAHEINNPIFIIGGFATRIEQLVDEKEILDKVDESKICLDMIQKNCKKVTNIVEGLRLMSRNSEKDEFEVFDLNEVIKRTLDISKDNFQMNSIDLVSELSDEEFLVECKPGQLSQVVTNLLNNSYDSLTSQGLKGWVKVETKSADGHVILSITDAGARLSDEVVKNIMEPFFTTKDPGKGTGLGLSICKEILKRFNGEISVDQNCPNVKFDIRLPLISFEDDEDEEEVN